MSQNDFYSGEVGLNYATAYCFLYYLLNHDNSTKKLLSDFVKTLKETGNSKQAYDATFEKVDVDKMQKVFEQFILKGK